MVVRNRFLYFGTVSSIRSFTDRIEAPGFANLKPDWSGATPEFMFDINQEGTKIYCAYNASSGANREIGTINISGYREGAGAPAGADAYFLENIVGLSSISPTADPGTIRGVVWNNDAQTFTVIGDGGFIITDADLNIIVQNVGGFWNVQTGAGGTAHMSNIDKTRFWVTAGSAASGDEKDTVRAYSTEDGALLEEIDLTDWTLTDNNRLTPWWQFGSDTYVAKGQTAPRLVFGERFGTGKITLSSVLLDMAKRTGVESSDLDLTALTRTIYGAPQKSGGATARGGWEDLLLMTDHYAAMIDGTLTVKPMETASKGTLTDIDLGADGKPELLQRTNSSAPAQRVELSYKSIPANMEPAIQADQFEVDVLAAGRTIKLQTALRMDDDEAWAIVQRIMSDASTAHTEMQISLPYTRGDIEPGEIWDVTSGSNLFPMRLGEIAGGRVMQLKGTSAYPFLTSADTPIDSSRPAPVLSQISGTEFALIDAHAWRDEFNGEQFSIAAWPRRESLRWDGAVISRSTSPDSFSNSFATLLSAVIAGQATAPLGDVPEADAGFDRGNTMNVRMVSGTPTSVTEEQVLLGSNAIWVECGATGEWELLQFATATEESDGTYTLSVLLRGRRGTEHLTALHAAADRVIWGDEDTARRKGGGNVGEALFYVASSIGRSVTLQDITSRRGFTNNARALRPYSVVDVAGTRDGSDNLTITWVRRSRILGSVQTTTVPLGETTEAYEIDIINVGSPSGEVIRTLSATSETVTYTIAQQTTDFGGAEDPVTIRIYQISAAFGRGVIREATI